jgi:hypothetical protein
MELDKITIREEPGRYESLGLALRAVAEAAGGEADYDALCAAMGVSLAAVSARCEPAPGWWQVYGRDAFVEPAARLFGIRLRNLSPPDVGVEMVTAAEFSQHFEASYAPLIRTAIGNNQPVLAWQGWAGTSAMFWGAITGIVDDQFEGVTLWSPGRVQLTGPALQCYVVEECEPQLAPRDQLLAMSLRHADAYLNRAPFAPVVAGIDVAGIVTGPAAYDAWEQWLSTGEFTGDPNVWREHRQHAEFIVASRQSALAFLASIRPIVAAEQQPLVDRVVQACTEESDSLQPSCDENAVRCEFATPAGRQRLFDALTRAEAANRRLAMTIEELAQATS